MTKTTHVAWLCLLSLAACSGDNSTPTPTQYPPVTGPSNSGGSSVTTNSGGGAVSQPDASMAPVGGSVEAGTMPSEGGTISEPDADVPPGDAFEGQGDPWMAPAPRATCANSDGVETGISGLDGDLHCNVEVMNKVTAPHSTSTAYYKDCFYVNGDDATTVIQVSPEGVPTVTATLTQTGFKASVESMKASAASGLLVSTEGAGATVAVADISKDCAHPEYKSSLSLASQDGLGLFIGHSGNFNADGTIYYATSMVSLNIVPVDLADPMNPKMIPGMLPNTQSHDVCTNKDSSRLYITSTAGPIPGVNGIGSFSIVDVSQIEARAPDAKAPVIKAVEWKDGEITQYPIFVTYRGKPHLILSDELGSGNCDDPSMPIWGYARIFDISDETNPTLASLVKTEAEDPENCMAPGQPGGGLIAFGVGTHYCNVDREDDPRVLACGLWAGGLRLYDIRNPWRPRQIGYFDTADSQVTGRARILAEQRQVWVATAPDQFYVLKIAPGSELDQALASD